MSSSRLFIKDWHLAKEYKGRYVAYDTPEIFCEDWINEYWDEANGRDDYRFVYMGPKGKEAAVAHNDWKGTWTPLHADVFRSYSWSANSKFQDVQSNWSSLWQKKVGFFQLFCFLVSHTELV
jgi:hypothetical protein